MLDSFIMKYSITVRSTNIFLLILDAHIVACSAVYEILIDIYAEGQTVRLNYIG